MNYVVSDYHTWMLQGRGRQIADFVEVDELEHAARVLFRHKRPYEGFPDVMQSLFSVIYSYDLPGQAAMLTIVAPCYSRIESLEQADRKHLSVAILGPPRAPASDFRLNVIMRNPDGVAERTVVRFKSGDRLDSPGYSRFVKKLKLGAAAPFVDLFLGHKSEHVDTARLVLAIRDTPNPRLLAHLAFDDDGMKLRRHLFPDSPKNATGFEIAVAWLLHLCGFEVVSYGIHQAKLDDEIDILAFVPLTKAMMAVECKASELKTDKLVLFANRYDSLKQVLPDYELVAAAVTSLDHATEPERQAARSLSISILTKVELEEMLTMAERHASPQEVLDYVRRKVPSNM